VPASATATAETTSSDPTQLESLLGKVIPFARTAEGLARRCVGKVRTLAIFGVLSAVWITYVCAATFDWTLATALAVFVPLIIPSAVLWKLYGMLSSVIGLPQRITDTAGRLYDKAAEHRSMYESRGRVDHNEPKPKFRQLWQTSMSLLEVKALTDETREVVSLAGGALVLANPVFAIVLASVSVITLLLAVIAAVVGLIYLL
jgi:hypothetical protein